MAGSRAWPMVLLLRDAAETQRFCWGRTTNAAQNAVCTLPAAAVQNADPGAGADQSIQLRSAGSETSQQSAHITGGACGAGNAHLLWVYAVLNPLLAGPEVPASAFQAFILRSSRAWLLRRDARALSSSVSQMLCARCACKL